MLGVYQDKITIQKREQTTGPLGSEVSWPNVKTVWGLMSSIDTKGQAEYQQLGYSNISYIAKFPQKIKLSLSGNRLKWNGQHYEIVAPPKYVGMGRHKTTVPVREVESSGN